MSRITVVTGTDTDIGKTIATAALAVVRGAEGTVTVVKPVQTGVGRHDGGDAAEVHRLTGTATQEFTAPYDAVLTPTVAQPPLPVGALRNDADPSADFEAQKAFTPWTSAWNVTGMPAISLPLHWTPDGLPVGVMLAARPAEEALLLALAAQVEEARPWRGLRAPGV